MQEEWASPCFHQGRQQHFLSKKSINSRRQLNNTVQLGMSLNYQLTCDDATFRASAKYELISDMPLTTLRVAVSGGSSSPTSLSESYPNEVI